MTHSPREQQVTIHTDTLNESSCVEQTVEAFEGRCIHTYHTEGAGGGHAPDILSVVGRTCHTHTHIAHIAL